MTTKPKVIVWRGTDSNGGTFSDPAAWRGGVAPGAGDVALFRGPGEFGETTAMGNGTVGRLALNGGISGGAHVYFTGTITALGLAGGASVTIGGFSEADFTSGSQLDAAAVVLSDGTLTATGGAYPGAQIYADSITIGAATNHGGDLRVANGAVLGTTGDVLIGGHGGGSFELDSGFAYIGNTNDGTGALTLGADTGGFGNLELAGDSFLFEGGLMSVGVHGTGILSVGAYADAYLYGGLSVGSGSEVAMLGGTVEASAITVSAGALVIGSGSFGGGLRFTDAALTNNGTIQASAGDLFITAKTVSGHGTFAVGAHADLTVFDGIHGKTTLAFLGPDGYLAPFSVGNGTTVDGFAPGDRLFLADAQSISFNDTTGTLTVTLTNGHTEALHFTGDFSSDTFALNSDVITVTKNAAWHWMPDMHHPSAGA